jgi:hypothetical protein
MALCAVCGSDVAESVPADSQSIGPPDFDTRPGEPLRSSIPDWVSQCPHCGYAADDLSKADPRAKAIVASDDYRTVLADARFPQQARPFLAYALLLEKLHQFADAGWSTLHAAWICDDLSLDDGASLCREQAIDRWKRGKLVGQLFADDMATEFALITDLYRRMGEFEHATVGCSEGLDLDDVPPAVEAMLRRQLVLIQNRDTSCHSMKELMHHVGR